MHIATTLHAPQKWVLKGRRLACTSPYYVHSAAKPLSSNLRRWQLEIRSNYGVRYVDFVQRKLPVWIESLQCSISYAIQPSCITVASDLTTQSSTMTLISKLCIGLGLLLLAHAYVGLSARPRACH